jgi:MerR family transcriptional regulator, copper efflux regulator
MLTIVKSVQMDLLQIGSVADRSNVPIKTIRYYEEIGLLKSSGRTEGKFRLFTPEVVERIGFIKRLQKLGLSLQEIAEILQVYDCGLIPCKEIEQRLKGQILEIDRHIAELTTLRGEINNLLKNWIPVKELESGKICPILEKDF